MATETDQKPLTKRSTPVVVAAEPRKSGCCGFRYIKALVTLYAFLYLLVGIILLIVGAVVLSIKSGFEDINDVVTNPAVVALIVGIVIIITALLGIIGAIKEKHLLLKIFFVIIILVFLLQILIGILAFIYRNETVNEVEQTLKDAIGEYDNDNVQGVVDRVQQHFECCGVQRPRDWDDNEVFKCMGSESNEYVCGVPDSCCREMSPLCGAGIRRDSGMNNRIFNNGCAHKFKVWLASNLDLVGGIGLGLALLHVLGIFVVYWFITKIEDKRKLFRYRSRHYED